VTKEQVLMGHATDQPDPQPSPEHDPMTCTPAETASRYQRAAAHYRDLAECGDYEGCEYVRDEMAMCLCQLAAAGRLDLIGAGA
jgi:hypothetical protein